MGITFVEKPAEHNKIPNTPIYLKTADSLLIMHLVGITFV